MDLFFDSQAYLHFGIALAAFIGARLAYRWPWLKWFVVILSVYLSLRYFLWRTLYTLNMESWIGILISVTLLLAECYGFLYARGAVGASYKATYLGLGLVKKIPSKSRKTAVTAGEGG